MNRPKITKQTAIAMAGLSQLNDLQIIGIRGYYRDTMGIPGKNDRGIYDDCICVVWPMGFVTFNANTDPSIFRAGIATLIPGSYPYKKGIHKGKYKCLRPATEGEILPVWRDSGDKIYNGVAINIHKGGYNTTSSEGCQTIYPTEYDEFLDLVYTLMDDYKQETVTYNLVDFH